MAQFYQQLSALMLCGGKSVRFGSEKGLATFQGRPLATRIVDILETISDDVLISTNWPDSYRALKKPMIEDVFPGHGPISGIHAALKVARHELLAVCACDMPFVSAELFRYMVQNADGYDVVVPITPFSATADGDKQYTVLYEPLHALYRRSCLPVFEAAIENKQYKITHSFDHLRVLLIPETLWHSVPGIDDHVFQNVNTRQDLERLENESPPPQE